jgi:lipoprotein signal peptidase
VADKFLPKNERTFLRSFVFWFLIIILLLIINQIFVNLAIPKELIFKNQNFLFSLPLPVPLMFIIYFVIIAGIFWYIFKSHKYFELLDWQAWSAVISGSFSNTIERIHLGYVRDFIYIGSGVFNTADLLIILGIVILIGRELRIKKVL